MEIKRPLGAFFLAFSLAAGAVLALSGCTTAGWRAASRSPSSMTTLSWPVPKDARLIRGFRNGFGRHDGLDLSSKLGTSIFSAHDGLVIYAGNEFTGYGNLVIIEDGTGWATFYSHCQKLLVRQGQRVQRGDLIASMGKTGNASGVHLHFELRRGGTPVDPLLFLP